MMILLYLLSFYIYILNFFKSNCKSNFKKGKEYTFIHGRGMVTKKTQKQLQALKWMFKD